MNNTPFWLTQRPGNLYDRYEAPYRPVFDSDSIDPFVRRSVFFQTTTDPIRGSRHPWQMPEQPFGFPGFPDFQRSPAPVEVVWFNGFPARPVNPRFSGPLPRTPIRQEDSRSSQDEQKKVLSKLRKEIYNPIPKQMTKRLNSYYRDRSRGTNEKGMGIDEDGKRCAVCLEDFEARENVMVTPCEHMFHEECILPWLKDRGDCPVCRSMIRDRTERTAASDNTVLNANDLFQREMSSMIRAMEEAFLWETSL